MTEETGWFEQATPAPPADSAGLPGTGPVAEPAPGPGPGTDVPGAAAAEPEPAAAEPAEHAAAAHTGHGGQAQFACRAAPERAAKG